jgi:TonB family protein
MAADRLSEPVDGIVTVTLLSGAWIKLRPVDIDRDQTAAHTNRVVIKATTSTTMTTKEGRKYLNLTFGPTFVATAWVEDVDWDETWQLAQGDFGPSMQFDTKGVDFGPWLKRFRTQVYKNWMIPYAAMSLHGHTTLRFTIRRDGTITDLVILQPSTVDAFTKSAFNALKAPDSGVPLPAEYPDDRMVMTVIFYYNETPGSAGGGLQTSVPRPSFL